MRLPEKVHEGRGCPHLGSGPGKKRGAASSGCKRRASTVTSPCTAPPPTGHQRRPWECGMWMPPAGPSGGSLALPRGPQNSVLTIFAAEPSIHPAGPRYKYPCICSASRKRVLIWRGLSWCSRVRSAVWPRGRGRWGGLLGTGLPEAPSPLHCPPPDSSPSPPAGASPPEGETAASGEDSPPTCAACRAFCARSPAFCNCALIPAGTALPYSCPRVPGGRRSLGAFYKHQALLCARRRVGVATALTKLA